MSKSSINKLLGLCIIVMVFMGIIIYKNTPDVNISYTQIEVLSQYKTKSDGDSGFKYYIRGNNGLYGEQEIKVSKKDYKVINYKDTVDCTIFAINDIKYIKIGRYDLNDISISSIKSSTVLSNPL